MNMYVILSRSQAEVHGVDLSLSKACQAAGIDYIRLVEEDVVLDDIQTMPIPHGSLVYRISLSAKATAIEAFMDAFHGDDITTIYYPQTITYPRKVMYEMLVQLAEGMSVIPTSIVDETWLGMSDTDLQKRVTAVGGFPVIIKTLGLSHGQGVARVEDVASLRDKLAAVSFAKYQTIIRKYLADYRHYRLIIVGNEVVAAIEYHKPADDFRTNAVAEPEVTAVNVADLPEDMKQLAIDTVTIRRSILGGVDILVESSNNKPMLAEVNVPCYYPRAEGPTGIDISSQLIKAMIQKQKEKKQ